MSPLLIRALQGEVTPRRPVWLMRQAGRMLPEYRALRERYSFEELSADPELAAEVTLQPVRRFDFDAAIVFADLVTPAAAMGLSFHFAPGPVLDRPIRTASQLDALRDPPPGEIGPQVAETLRRVRRELDPDRALLGFAGSPWSLAAYLVQGAGKTGFPALRAMLAADPALAGRLFHRLAKLVAGYALEQANSGADAIQIFESWAGLLSLADYRRHVVPHLRDLFQELGRVGVPRILFLHGAPHLVPIARELPIEGLSVCWRCDMPAIRAELGEEIALQGNLDPAILLAGPEATRLATESMLAAMPARAHIVNLGHGVLPETPLESVAALLDVVHHESRHVPT